MFFCSKLIKSMFILIIMNMDLINLNIVLIRIDMDYGITSIT